MRVTAKQPVEKTEGDLRRAILRGSPVTVDYVADDGTKSVRTVEPHDIRVTNDGETVMVAMCRLRRSRRTFRVDRITHYTVHHGKFEMELDRPNPDEVTDWWTIQSRTGHEVIQLELNTDGKSNPYALVLAEGMRLSNKVRAVSKAEGGVSIRRLRRRDVKALS